VKSLRDEMEIVNAYELVGTYRGAAALCGTAPIAVDPGTGAGPSDPAPVVTVPTRSGYWMLAADGRVFPFGDAAVGGTASTSSPIVGVGRLP